MSANIFDNEEIPHKIYLRRKVNEIQQDDNEIQVIGFAREVNPSQEFSIEDDTGRYRVRDIPETIDTITEGTLYRVFGEISIDHSGVQFLSAKFIQNMTGLDQKQYDKVVNLLKKYP